jgi:hypothetical protein
MSPLIGILEIKWVSVLCATARGIAVTRLLPLLMGLCRIRLLLNLRTGYLFYLI